METAIVYWGNIGIMENGMETTIIGLYELLSKLLVSPLITPIVVPNIIPYITPL